MDKEEFIKRVLKEYPIPKTLFVPAPILISRGAEDFKMYTEYLEREFTKINKALAKRKKDS